MKTDLRDINKLLGQELNRKMTVQEMEDHAKACKEEVERHNLSYPKLYPDAPKQIEFYKGFLRAFELLRKYGYLKE